MSQSASGRTREVRVALPLCRSGLGLGTGVQTTDGEIPVEFLEPGDRIITYDRGAVALSRLVVRKVPACELVRIRPAVLEATARDTAMVIAARQKVLLRGWQARARFGKSAVLIEAARLVDGEHVTRLHGSAPMRLFQLVFEDGQHLLRLGDGRLLVTSARVRVPVPA